MGRREPSFDKLQHPVIRAHVVDLAHMRMVQRLLTVQKCLDKRPEAGHAVCALVFGGSHFVYMNLTAPLVPKWLPPTQEFWGYATGVGFVAAGVAILIGVQARLAAILVTAMLASFALLVHEPMLLAGHSIHMNWTESAVNLAVTGAAWVVANSLARPRR